MCILDKLHAIEAVIVVNADVVHGPAGDSNDSGSTGW